MKFRELLESRKFESLSLYHVDEDVEEYTLCDFSIESFTEEGLVEWADVLDSTVVLFKDEPIAMVWVSHVKPARVEKLQGSHAGTCSSALWDLWFQENEEFSIELDDDEVLTFTLDIDTEAMN